VVDGSGFAVEAGATAIKLVADVARGEGDEFAMELSACTLASGGHTVIDRHTGRHWSGALLEAWLSVTGLLSGRALAVNEERIAHRTAPTAARAFESRVETITGHLLRTPSPALRARAIDELSYYASRPALMWSSARGLGRLGDLRRLEDLSREAAEETRSAAFVIAAELGGEALVLFERAFDDADPNRRRSAAKVLHRVTDRAVLPLVVRALDDRRSTVREAILESGFDRLLSLDAGRTVLGPALHRRASDPSTLVRKLAARHR
jgi:hypothetical protein